MQRLQKENNNLRLSLKEAERGWQDAILFARDMQSHLTTKEDKFKEAQAKITQLSNQVNRLQSREMNLSIHSPDFSVSSHSVATADDGKEARIYLLQSELKLYRDGVASNARKTEFINEQIKSVQTDISLSTSKAMHSAYTLFRAISASALAGEVFLIEKDLERVQASAKSLRTHSETLEGDILSM
jgi:hypothetical protein